MLCWGLVQARREHISRANIEPVYYNSILGGPEHGHQRHETPKVVQSI